MFTVDNLDPRLLALRREGTDKIASLLKPKPEVRDDRPLINQVLDPEFTYQDISVTDYSVTTSRGISIVEKDELIDLCSRQAFCVEPTDCVGPLLPPRGVECTGQLKLLADVVAMIPKVRKVDKVLVIGSSSELVASGYAYFLLAGRVAEVHMYDPAEKVTDTVVIRGTTFRFFKEFWRHREVKGFDVVFDDAWSHGSTIYHHIEAREYSQKVFDIKEHRSKVRQKGFYHGQIHVKEKRFTKTPRYYRGYRPIGSCVACIEIGYFDVAFDVYDTMILSVCHGSFKCVNNLGLKGKRPSVYADLLLCQTCDVKPSYERAVSTAACRGQACVEDSVFYVKNIKVFRRVNGGPYGGLKMSDFDDRVTGDIVSIVSVLPYLAYVSGGVLVIMGDCYKVCDRVTPCYKSNLNDFDGYYVSAEVDRDVVDVPLEPFWLFMGHTIVEFTPGQVRRLIYNTCLKVFKRMRMGC